jgi:hypothetical protein
MYLKGYKLIYYIFMEVNASFAKINRLQCHEHLDRTPQTQAHAPACFIPDADRRIKLVFNTIKSIRPDLGTPGIS